jgi:iron complex outermembrane receptor protein
MMKALALATCSLAALAYPQVCMAQNDLPPSGDANAPDEESEAQAERPSAGGDIVVTATRIATNVQDVPIAITALTSEALEERQITTFSDLGAVVPNATFRRSQGIYGAGVSVNIRGLGTTDTQFSQEPAVAYYIDDVYYPFLFGSNFDLLDLERVEVLRGPQGTLFGRNAITGAVNMVSRRPDFDELGGYVDFTVGSYNRMEVRAGLNVPVTDTLAVMVSGVAKKRTGYMDVLDFSCEMHRRGTPQLAGTLPFATGKTAFGAGRTPDSCVIDHYGGEDAHAVRGAVRWQPVPGVELNITGDYVKSNDEQAAEKAFEFDYHLTYGRVRVKQNPDGSTGAFWGDYTGVINPAVANQGFLSMFDRYSIPGTPFRWDERFELDDMYQTYETMCDPIARGTQINDPRHVSPTNPTGRHPYYNGSLFRGGNCWGRTVPLENWGFSGKLNVEITDEIEATAIAGYREIDTTFGSGWDGTPLSDSIIYHDDQMWYFNGEFRLSGQHGWLDWVGGLFYYDGFADEDGRPQNVRLGTQQYQNVYYYPEAKAAYLNVTVRPSEIFGVLEGLSFNGGIRRSDDQKRVEYAALQDASAPGSTTFTPAASSTIFNINIANKRWDWKLGADYEITPDAMVYGSVATGYRLPAFATRVFQAGQIQQQFPTSLINYELGFKVDLFDGRLRLNGAAFWMAYQSRNGTFSGNEPRYDPSNPVLTVLPGTTVSNTMTLVPDGPDDTEWETAFTNCRPYNAATDGSINIAAGVGIQCINRDWNYEVKGGDPIRGLELEVFAEPIDRLAINGAVGYTDRGSTTGRPIGFPDWTASAGVQYLIDLPVLDGSITPRLDWFWNSTIAYSNDYTHLDQGPRSTFNGRLTYKNDEMRMDVALGVTNLLDEHYYRNKTVFIQGLGAGANIGQPAPPREWYLSVSKRF